MLDILQALKTYGKTWALKLRSSQSSRQDRCLKQVIVVVMVSVCAKKSGGSREKMVNCGWGGVGNVDSQRKNLEE